MPDDLKNALHEIRTKLPKPAMKFNSCLISCYRSSDNFIAPHRYDEPIINPEFHIVTLSIGANQSIEFTDNDGSIKLDQQLVHRSVLICSRFFQDFWMHGITLSRAPGKGSLGMCLMIFECNIASHFVMLQLNFNYHIWQF